MHAFTKTQTDYNKRKKTISIKTFYVMFTLNSFYICSTWLTSKALIHPVLRYCFIYLFKDVKLTWRRKEKQTCETDRKRGFTVDRPKGCISKTVKHVILFVTFKKIRFFVCVTVHFCTLCKASTRTFSDKPEIGRKVKEEAKQYCTGFMTWGQIRVLLSETISRQIIGYWEAKKNKNIKSHFMQ